MNNEIGRKSAKPYVLAALLWFIFFLVIYENQIPEFAVRVMDFFQGSYSTARKVFQTAQPKAPATIETTQPALAPYMSIHDLGDTLRIISPEAPTLLNPHLSSSLQDWEPSRITYEPLASFDKDGNLIPFLAADIPSLENGGLAADGKSVTWKLRHDVKWSDGTPFTAEDVRFTYQFDINPEVNTPYAENYEVVESLEVLDPYTVKINFKNVNPAWATLFVGIEGTILPRHIFEQYNNSNAREAPANTLPVGTGPYRAVPPGIKTQEVLLLGTQLLETNKIIFEPNPYFREPEALHFSHIEFRGGGTSEEAARLVFQEGAVDYAFGVETLSNEVLENMMQGEHGRLIINWGSGCERIALNRTDPNRATQDGERSSVSFPHPLFRDKRIRQAIAYAIDRNAIVQAFGPAGRPTNNNLIAPPQYNSPNVFYTFNLTKAAELLEEAGWSDRDYDGIREKDGVKMKLVYQAYVGEAAQQTQRIVQDALESIGIEVELKIVDSSIMFGSPLENPDNIRRFNADMQEFFRMSPSPDPGSYMKGWTCSQIPQKVNNWIGANYERWCNQEYDALYQQTTVEVDPKRRQQLFIQMNDLLIEDVVMIPLVDWADVRGVSQTIDGIVLTPWDANTWNIKDWKRVTQE